MGPRNGSVWAGRLCMLAAALGLGSEAGAQMSCDELAEPGLFSNTTVRSALPAVTEQGLSYCLVSAVIEAVQGSRIIAAYRLPRPGSWNGRLLGFGGGGFSGKLGGNPDAGIAEVERGYAVAASDAGHPGGPFETGWGLRADGTPNRTAILDFGERAVHRMTVVAKQVVAAYFGRPADYAYYDDCSTGGRMGLVEVQRFPQDYDGVVVGAPVMHMARVTTTGIWQGRAFHGAGRQAPTAEQLGYLADAVVAKCDGLDGVADGVLQDPLACEWDPDRVSCLADASPLCLQPDQVEAVREIYSGPITGDGTALHVPVPPGGEGDWAHWLLPGRTGPLGGAYGLAAAYMRDLIFQDPAYDAMTQFDFDSDVATVDRSLITATADAVNPDIRPFIEAGGKLLIYHGWGDVLVPALRTVAYYDAMVGAIGPALAAGTERTPQEALQAYARLLMMPGTYHCHRGPGAYDFDRLGVITDWVERGIAPDRVIARHPASDNGEPGFTRPLCPYPEIAHYQGPAGDPAAARLAQNFECRPPDRPE